MSTENNQSANGNNNTLTNQQVIIEKFELNINNLSTLLSRILPNLLIEIRVQSVQLNSTTDGVPYNIDEKMDYNHLNGYRCWIEEYYRYGTIVDEIYDAIDSEVAGGKIVYLEYLKAQYIQQKSSLLAVAKPVKGKEIDVIRQNADSIFKNVHDVVLTQVKKINLVGMSNEQLEFAVMVLISHGFVNCKILEKPKVQVPGNP